MPQPGRTDELPSTIHEVLTTTRAVRKRLDLTREVPPEVISTCLEIALQAPTAGARENWRWIVITDPQVRAEIAVVYRQHNVQRFRRALHHANTEETRSAYRGALHLANTLGEVPALVIACALGRVEGRSNAEMSAFYASILPAVWSFQLALRSRGLGTVLTTAHLQGEDEIGRILKVPSDVSQFAMLPVAYTLGTNFTRARRKPVRDVAFLNEWGAPFDNAPLAATKETP